MTSAFYKLKDEVCKEVSLAFPDYSEQAHPLELFTDASGFCMGGYLRQKQYSNGEPHDRVIGYVSKAFNKAERAYSTIERELAALRFCVKAFM